MTFLTTRFGEIDVPEEKAITIPDGVLGFPGRTRFLVLTISGTSLSRGSSRWTTRTWPSSSPIPGRSRPNTSRPSGRRR